MDLVTIVAVLVAAGAVGGLVAAVVLLIRRRSPETAARPRPTPIPEPAGQPQPYIAIDVDGIFDLYEQTDEAAVLQWTRSTRSTALKLDAGVGPVNGGVARDMGGETETQFLPVESAPRAASIVERRLQVTGRITSFDLRVSTDEGPLVNLLKSLHAEADSIGLTIPDEVENGLRGAWRKRGRLSTDTTLESLGQFVRVRAEFAITPGSAPGERVLESHWQDGSGDVTVRIVCSRDHVRPTFPDGSRRITATCLGIPNWDGQGLLELQILSIYRS